MGCGQGGQEAQAAHGLGLDWKGNACTTDRTAELEGSRLRGSVCAQCRRVLAADRTAQSPRQLPLLRASIFPSSSFLSLSSERWALPMPWNILGITVD